MKIADLFVDIKLGDISGLERGVTAATTRVGRKAGSSLGDSIADAAGSSTKLSKAGSQIGEQLTRDINGKLRDSSGKFVSEGNAAGRKIGASASGSVSASLSKGMKGIGGIIGGAFAVDAIVGFGREIVNLEATFSQTMATIGAVTSAPAAEMEKLNKLAMDLGASTSFSAAEASTAMLELAKSGLTPATIQAGALQGTLTLAAAGGTELGTAATIASNALNTFKLSGSDMASVAAALAGGANASSASVESLGQALAQVGPGAVNAGLSLQETVAALAAFDNAGIKGSDAGTSLKTMLASLTPATDAAADKMRKLGLDFVDAQGNFVPLSNVAEQLRTRLGGLSEAQRQAALETIFGSDASRAAAVLMQEGAKGVDSYVKATNDRGAAEAAAAARSSGTAGAMERLSGSVETAKLRLGQLIAPAIIGGADLLARAFGAVPGIIDRLTASFHSGSGAGTFFRDLIDGISTFVSQHLVPALRDFAEGIMPAVQKLFVSVSKTLRDNQAGIRGVGSVFKVLGLLLTDVVLPVMKTLIVDRLRLLGPAFQAAAFVITRVVIPVIKHLLRIFVNAMDGILTAAAKAFGWIPGLGDRLKAAQAQFRTFRDRVNSELDKTHDKKEIRVTTPGSTGSIKAIQKLRDEMVKVKGAAVPLAVAVGVSNKVAANLNRFTGDGYGIAELPALRTGGKLRGPGTGRSDSILGVDYNGLPTARVSAGEFVTNAKATNENLPLLEAINAGVLSMRDLMPQAMANGGKPVNLRVQTEAQVEAAARALAAQASNLAMAPGGDAAQPGGGGGVGMGYKRQMQILHGAFPGLQLISGFRPGAITATGNKSYHGKGRAVDIPPSMKVFNWIRSHYGRSARELIFTPAGSRQIWNGKPHVYRGVTARMHYNHVHWAMKSGGLVGAAERRERTSHAGALERLRDNYRVNLKGARTAKQRASARRAYTSAVAKENASYRRDLAAARKQDAADRKTKAADAARARTESFRDLSTSVRGAAGGDYYGNQAGTAGLIGAATSGDDVRSALQPYQAAIRGARGSGISTRRADTVLRSMAVTNGRLQRMVRQRADIAKRLEAANATLEDRRDAASNAAAGVRSYAGILQGQGEGVTAGSVRGVMSARLAVIRRFVANIAALKRQGWSQAIIRQVVDAGPEAGAAMADALVKANPRDRAQINSLQGSIDKAAASYQGTAFAAIGGNVAQGIVNGLNAQDRNVRKAMESLADSMVRYIKKALGIKSPSRVFAELGRQVPAGFAVGIDNGAADAVRALDRMYALPAAVGTGASRGPARAVASAPVAGRAAPIQHVENLHIHSAVDAATMTQQLEFLARRASI